MCGHIFQLKNNSHRCCGDCILKERNNIHTSCLQLVMKPLLPNKLLPLEVKTLLPNCTTTLQQHELNFCEEKKLTSINLHPCKIFTHPLLPMSLTTSATSIPPQHLPVSRYTPGHTTHLLLLLLPHLHTGKGAPHPVAGSWLGQTLVRKNTEQRG